MEITLNGARHEVTKGITVGRLVDEIVGKSSGIAVAINATVVPRSTWDRVELQAQDRVEVLTAAPGG